MKIVSLNLRGWGGSAKRKRLSSFLQKGVFDVCLLQETKKASIEDYLIHSLWGYKDVRWVVKEPEGIKVERQGIVMHIVNIYLPCSLSGKKKLWEDLLAFKQQSGGGEWCLGGDFNVVLHSSERKGSSADNRQGERLLFNLFVEEMEVIDVP
ncbi:hypothetical protein A2U01_0024957, partial [Trifolium medium]|nr:hypothetical protein [Trifolium medium]